ncbi:MAG: signal peptidase II [Endomicrobium sp.]|jgi:signal peptidase II|nr:signal peptidase II [Endomicrobium sp.]
MARLKSVLFTILIFIDQILKYLVVCYIPYCSYVNCISFNNLFNIVHVHNTGIAFGLFYKYESNLLIIIFILLLLMIIYLYNYWYKLHRMIRIAFCLIISGGISNLIDRLFHNYVIDFVDIGVNLIRYPTFNTADIYICIGFIILFININKIGNDLI